MLKKSYLLIASVLLLGGVLQAEENVPAVDEAPAAADQTAVVAESPEIPAAPAVEVSESELIELVGYLTAQGSGVPTLKLDEAGISALADGLQQGLAGELSLEDLPQETIQTAFAQAQARAEAVQAGSEELPAIDADALQIIGSLMVSQSGLTQLGFDADDAAAITKGFIAGAGVTEPDPSITAKMPAFQEYIQSRVAEAQAAAAVEAERAAAEAAAAVKTYFEGLAADADVQKSESGLYFKVLEPGTEEMPAMTDSVLVHYKGTLIDGTQFDSSYDRDAPAEFPLSGVVPGFGEGLTKIGVGGKIILYIPSELGYGNSPRPGGVIKPGDALVFECELIEINPGDKSDVKTDAGQEDVMTD